MLWMNDKSGSELIDEKLKTLGDWRGALLARLRRLIKEADPAVVETSEMAQALKPARRSSLGTSGNDLTGESYKDKVKLTFAKGASVDDPSGLFNSSLDGGTRRAIDFREGDDVDEQAFKALIRKAAELNGAF